jgi:hypothetical protein
MIVRDVSVPIPSTEKKVFKGPKTLPMRVGMTQGHGLGGSTLMQVLSAAHSVSAPTPKFSRVPPPPRARAR